MQSGVLLFKLIYIFYQYVCDVMCLLVLKLPERWKIKDYDKILLWIKYAKDWWVASLVYRTWQKQNNYKKNT